MAAWLLPDHIADVLPAQARHVEALRRLLLDTAAGYGYELVIPPMLEHLESLLTGTGEALDLQTFKLVDQLSGRTLGLRADTTPQVARIDAHLLNRAGVSRLCYCGSVLHTLPSRPHATREPMQFGAEIYGCTDLHADLEVLLLALDCLGAVAVKDVRVDMADVRVVRSLLADCALAPMEVSRIHNALAAKDSSELMALTASLPSAIRQALLCLPRLYGDVQVLDEAQRVLPQSPPLTQAIAQLRWLAARLPQVQLSFDLADLSGYAYYSGMRFAIYAPGANDSLVRGGRYDEVGAVFGRNRPAVGFSLDVKELAAVAAQRAHPGVIRAPALDGSDVDLLAAVSALRSRGETVVCEMPETVANTQEPRPERELVCVAGQWLVQAVG